MIIDGHAHVYTENNAAKIISSFTELHHITSIRIKRHGFLHCFSLFFHYFSLQASNIHCSNQ